MNIDIKNSVWYRVKIISLITPTQKEELKELVHLGYDYIINYLITQDIKYHEYNIDDTTEEILLSENSGNSTIEFIDDDGNTISDNSILDNGEYKNIAVIDLYAIRDEEALIFDTLRNKNDRYGIREFAKRHNMLYSKDGFEHLINAEEVTLSTSLVYFV